MACFRRLCATAVAIAAGGAGGEGTAGGDGGSGGDALANATATGSGAASVEARAEATAGRGNRASPPGQPGVVGAASATARGVSGTGDVLVHTITDADAPLTAVDTVSGGTASGFDELRFRVEVGGVVAGEQIFTSLALAQAFFIDTLFPLPAIAGGAAGEFVRVVFEADLGAGDQLSLALAVVPEPSTGTLIVVSLIAFARRARDDRHLACEPVPRARSSAARGSAWGHFPRSGIGGGV